ncbi:MAG TPA: hypothetical protein VL523_11020 [Terriglobia bacterium]|nr:hypothetical protein [Terriglobia bacterium]
MKARFAIIIAAVMMAVSVPAARAQRADQPPSRPDNGRFGDPTETARNLQGFVYGVVKTIGPSEIVCDKTEFGDGQAFKLDKKTKFYRDGQPGSASDLKAGDDVWVKIHKDKKSGEMTALRVVSGMFPADANIK